MISRESCKSITIKHTSIVGTTTNSFKMLLRGKCLFAKLLTDMLLLTLKNAKTTLKNLFESCFFVFFTHNKIIYEFWEITSCLLRL